MSTLAPIDKSDPSLHILVPPFVVHLAQFPALTPIPDTLFQLNLPFLSVIRSPGETTILYGLPKYYISEPGVRFEAGSEGYLTSVSGIGVYPTHRDGPYAVLRVRGPLVLTLTGILNELTTPLRVAEVPIYAVSTWDTDYVLVPAGKLETATKALTGAGWTVEEQEQELDRSE